MEQDYRDSPQKVYAEDRRIVALGGNYTKIPLRQPDAWGCPQVATQNHKALADLEQDPAVMNDRPCKRIWFSE